MIKTKYVFQDFEWFNKNAFSDDDGDFWKSKEDAARYVNTHNDIEDSDAMIYSEDVGRIFDEESIPMEDFHWGVKMIVTSKSHPEYFL